MSNVKPETVIATPVGGSSRDIVLAIELDGSHITEHQIAVRKGMTFYILTTDSRIEPITGCQSDFQYIQLHLILPK